MDARFINAMGGKVQQIATGLASVERTSEDALRQSAALTERVRELEAFAEAFAALVHRVRVLEASPASASLLEAVEKRVRVLEAPSPKV